MTDKELFRMSEEIVYEGMVLPGDVILPETIETIRNSLTVNADDVVIASYPRSGNTWLSEALYLIHSEGDFESAEKIKHYDRIIYVEREPFILGSGPNNLHRLKERQGNGQPTVIKTHLPAQYFQRQIENENARVVHVMRNPKDLIVSLYHYYKSSTVIQFNGSMDDFIALWRARRLIYGDSIDFNISYWRKRHLPNVLIITFEEAQEDIMSVLRKLAAFLNKTLSDNLLEKIKQHISFENMQVNPSVNSVHNPTVKGNFIRKGKVGNWKTVLTVAQSEEIDRVYEERIKEAHLPVTYTL